MISDRGVDRSKLTISTAGVMISAASGDGLADILFDDFDGNESRSYRIAAQDGGFGAAFPLPDSTAPAISIWEVYDIDGDGAPDILNAASDGQFYTRFGDPDQANYFSNSENIKGPFTIGAVGSMVFGHFDGDERIDVAWTSGVDIGVVLQPVHRTFADAETVARMNFGLALAAVDTDGDGLSTAIGFGSFPSSMFGYAGSPLELTFEVPSYPADTTLTLKALGVGLDGDAGEELVTISFDEQNTCDDFDQDACARPLVLVHGGSGGEVDTQSPYPLPSPGLVPSQIQSADMDGDGDADLVLLDLNADAVHVYRNLGDGTFSSPVIIGFDVTTIGDRLQLGDINGDEKADIAIASNDANIRFLLSSN